MFVHRHRFPEFWSGKIKQTDVHIVADDTHPLTEGMIMCLPVVAGTGQTKCLMTGRSVIQESSLDDPLVFHSLAGTGLAGDATYSNYNRLRITQPDGFYDSKLVRHATLIVSLYWNGIAASESCSLVGFSKVGNEPVMLLTDLSASSFRLHAHYSATNKWENDLYYDLDSEYGVGLHHLGFNANADDPMGDALELFVDGESVAKASGSSSTAANFTAYGTDVGLGVGGYMLKNANNHGGLMYNRLLPQHQHEWLVSEPWAYLRPETIRTHFLPSESPGGPSASPWFFHNRILRHRRGS